MVLTYIYAMLNLRSGFVKIGRSDSPVFRETTLQSEEPEVHLIYAYLCDPSLEKRMHRMFSEKRIRGEWFRLSLEDIEDIEVLEEHLALSSVENFIINQKIHGKVQTALWKGRGFSPQQAVSALDRMIKEGL